MRNLNIHKLQESLNKLCETLNSLYSINSGGCCYVAYLISKWLDRFGIDYQLVIYDYKKRSTLGISYEVQNMRRGQSSCNSVSGSNSCEHYCLLIIGGGYVNRGDVTGLKQYSISGITNKNIRWIYRTGYWNKMYNTRNNRVVKNMINSFFKNYEE